MPKPSTVIYDDAITMYLKDKNGYTNKCEIFGETSRSWLAGTKWNPGEFKYAKAEYCVITKEEHDERWWEETHRYRISSRIGQTLPLGVLRKVAELIGFEAGK